MRLKRRTIVIVLVAVAVLIGSGIAMRDHVAAIHAHVFSAIHGH